MKDENVLKNNYHNTTMNKASPQSRRSKMRILLGARNLDVPDLLPSLVKAFMHGIHARVMRAYAVTAHGRNAVILGELLVQCHVQHQVGHILVEVGLLVIPHVGKPRKSADGKWQ